MKNTIVIVDADIKTRLILKKLLIEENYNVVSEGKDGFEAIDICKSKKTRSSYHQYRVAYIKWYQSWEKLLWKIMQKL